MPLTNNLSDLEISHVSLTAQGIDQDAHVKLAKAAAPEETLMATIPDALRKALGDETADGLTEEQTKALADVFASASAPATPTAPADPTVAAPAEATKVDPAAPVTAAIDATATVAETTTAVEATTAVEPVAKSAAMVTLEKSLADTRTELAAERTLREERDFVAENTDRFEHLGDGAVAVAKSWFAIRKGIGTDEDRERLDKALAGASEQIGNAPVVGTEMGTSAGAGDVTGMSSITTLAKAARADNPDLSESDATARVMATPEGQAAYEAYDEGRRARIRDAR